VGQAEGAADHVAANWRSVYTEAKTEYAEETKAAVNRNARWLLWLAAVTAVSLERR